MAFSSYCGDMNFDIFLIITIKH